MVGPMNGILGDADNFGTDLPQTQPQTQQIAAEQRMARFSRTKEFKVLEEYLQSRIAFYQTQLPDGRPLSEVDTNERGQMWLIANAVIGELSGIVAAYKKAEEVVKKSK